MNTPALGAAGNPSAGGAANPRNGRRSRLIWPARERWTGNQVWLSSGQRALLFYLRGQLAAGRHEFRIDDLARITGLDRSNVSRGLDRLASLSLIGRRSTRGCMGRTIVWNVGRRRAWTEAQTAALRFRRPINPRGNVATSNPFGVYLSREGWQTAIRNGQDRAVRRLTPPRTLYGRCAARHRVRLTRWTFRRTPGDRPGVVRSFEGVWLGKCRRCGERVRLADSVTVPAPSRPGWESAGAVLGSGGRYRMQRDTDGTFSPIRRDDREGSP